MNELYEYKCLMDYDTFSVNVLICYCNCNEMIIVLTANENKMHKENTQLNIYIAILII